MIYITAVDLDSPRQSVLDLSKGRDMSSLYRPIEQFICSEYLWTKSQIHLNSQINTPQTEIIRSSSWNYILKEAAWRFFA